MRSLEALPSSLAMGPGKDAAKAIDRMIREKDGETVKIDGRIAGRLFHGVHRNMILLIIRHGQSEADLLDVHEGRADFP